MRVEQAASLTRRLLAFARKQPLEPRNVNINQFVLGMKPLLQRALGEQIDIAMKAGADLWTAYVDAHQVEAAVLNLAINARDAMPEGGHLMIETGNVSLDEEMAARYGDVTPGDYVSLSVSDDGSGMTPEVLARATEPFFTTKPAGKGTGLGLSMVYGFAKQSGGHMNIYSEVGVGTTVRLYFPRARAAIADAAPAGAGRDAAPGGNETILVVEDEAAVRELAVATLTGLGYKVLEAANGRDALALTAATPAIDLLFTDVVMPGGMGGQALAEELRKSRPGLRVLYCSGYTENAILQQGRLNGDTGLLQKPYRRHDLARKVRAILDGPSRQIDAGADRASAKPAGGTSRTGRRPPLSADGSASRGSRPPLRPQQLPIADPGLEPVVEALEAEELVGSVVILIGGREREEDRFGADGVAEDEPDGDRRPHANPERALAIDLRQHPLRQCQPRMVVGNGIGARAVIARRHLQASRPGGQCSRRCFEIAATTASGSWSGTRRQVILAMAWLGMTVLVPGP